jgi:hypothetical protein
MFRLTSRTLVFVLLLMAAACGDDDPTTPTEPTPPATVTENFSGTLNPNGGATHPFAAQRSGTISATLTAVAPDSAIVMGLSLGTWNGAACQIVLANDNATQGTVVTALASSLGSFCVRVYDVGRLVEPTSYELQVVHP